MCTPWRRRFLRRPATLLIALALAGCAAQPLVTRPPVERPAAASFIVRDDGTRLYTELRQPAATPRGVIFTVLGPEIPSAETTPTFHAAALDAGYALATVHPRGSGYSDGPRGDVDPYSDVLADLRWGWERLATQLPGTPRYLMGHSAGACLALEVAATSKVTAHGIVLVNPPFKMTYQDGMGPSFTDYVSFGFNYVFRPSALTVDMNSRPEAVAFAPDREEAMRSQADPLVVRYFSLRYLSAQKEVMDRTATNAARVTAPLLLVQGAHDQLVDPVGNDELLEASASADKRRLIAEEGGHGASAVETEVDALMDWLQTH